MRAILLSHLLVLWRRVRPLGAWIEAEARDLARDDALPGWHLDRRERRVLDGQIAFEVLSNEMDGKVAARACDLTTSLTAIRAALKEKVPAGTLERRLAEVVAAIDLAGGIKRERSETLVRQ